MRCHWFQLLVLVALIMGAVAVASAQTDPSNIFGPPKEPPPKNIVETMEKMRIARDKKDFDEMVGRGEEVRKIADDIEHAYELNARLTPSELEKLDSVEKLVRKIRSELGGNDDDSDDPEPDAAPEVRPTKLSPADALKTLRDTAEKLYTEIKKTTRFSVSVLAIQTSNAVLRLTRFLKITH